MKETLDVITATQEYVEEIYPLLRKADMKELKAGQGIFTPKERLEASFNNAEQCYVGISKSTRKPVLIFGVNPSLTASTGIIWMMGTDEITSHKKHLFAHTQYWLDKLGSKYEVLSNIVMASNRLHVNWIMKVGFFVFRKPIFLEGYKYYLFWMFPGRHKLIEEMLKEVKNNV